jgi:hypothetical protein
MLAPTPPDILQAELARYGVVLTGNWSVAQKTAIRDAVFDIAARFVQFRNASEPQDFYFQRIMGVATAGVSNWGNITIALGASGALPGKCNTTDIIGSQLVNCATNMTITKYTIVHELGHIFQTQSGPISSPTSLTGYVDSTVIISLHYPFSTSSIFTNFQQDPAPYANHTVANQETASDMFLNWVYAVSNPAGFLDLSWRPEFCTAPAGCSDSTNPGKARLDWMINPTTGVLTLIFNAHGW